MTGAGGESGAFGAGVRPLTTLPFQGSVQPVADPWTVIDGRAGVALRTASSAWGALPANVSDVSGVPLNTLPPIEVTLAGMV